MSMEMRPERLTSYQAKNQISRRVKVSKWFTGGALAVGLGSGLFLANTANSKDTERNALAADVAISAVVLAAGEKLLAHRSVNGTVRRFAIDRAAEVGRETIDSGEMIRVVHPRDGSLSEITIRDLHAQRTSAVDTLLAAGSPLFGYMGTATAVRGIKEASTAPIPATVSGDVLAGLAATLSGILVYSDHLMMGELESSSYARIDNIEGGLQIASE